VQLCFKFVFRPGDMSVIVSDNAAEFDFLKLKIMSYISCFVDSTSIVNCVTFLLYDNIY